MKTLFLFFLVAIISISCNRQKKLVVKKSTVNTTINNNDNGVLATKNVNQVRLKIIRKSCASLVAQILDESYYNLGEEWAPYNARLKESLKNVVNIANKCAIPETINENEIIKVKLIVENDEKSKDCIACMMMDYPPTKKIYVKFLNSEEVKIK